MTGFIFSKNNYCYYLFLFILFGSCTPNKKKRAAQLYTTHCASCHVLPNIEDLPKNIWETGVLPEMAARMGIIYDGNDPYINLTFKEQEARMISGIYPAKPIIPVEDWNDLKDYILSLAPDSLLHPEAVKAPKELTQFRPTEVKLDARKGTFITFLEYNNDDKSIITADLNGVVKKLSIPSDSVHQIFQTEQAVTSYIETNRFSYTTSVGYLNPSEIARGYLRIANKSINHRLPFTLHRPVHTLVEDLNGDGTEELVICEFGHLTGGLSLFVEQDSLNFTRELLLNAPGTTRTIARDMNGDEKLDLVVLSSQGRENITILYQEDNLTFVPETVIRFNPVYGSSWFELIDFDGDGDDDILTVHGDNADKSYVQKPYHGLRIHLNDGKNKFTEQFFYPLNGATRLVSNDFDNDGDIDIALLATFPDYENKPKSSFVYLENLDAKTFQFQDFTFEDANKGRWLLMDSGDIDKDGDEDIILSAFTYGFTPVPEYLADIWDDSDTDIMILENNLYQN
ncbi:FG-GAP-like repeat-containing protein [Maribacter sp. R77961]|uniref:FG-GAP-like repeat-containing protein n=1 Tax=Maribacter sp. R77961 TaxID=3093871 RepID=UPI0037C621E1